MIQQARQHDVQTLEASPLDALLDRSFVPKNLRRDRSVSTPKESQPTRWQVVDYIIARFGHCPPPDCDIIYGAVFCDVAIPTTGKLYIDCLFVGACYLEDASDRWDLVDCIVFNSPVMSKQVRSCERVALLLGNLIVDRPELEHC